MSCILVRTLFNNQILIVWNVDLIKEQELVLYLYIQNFHPISTFLWPFPADFFSPVTIRHLLKHPFPFYFIYFHLAPFLLSPPSLPPSLSSWPCYAAQCINSGMKNSQQRHGGIVDANDSELQEQRVKRLGLCTEAVPPRRQRGVARRPTVFAL